MAGNHIEELSTIDLVEELTRRASTNDRFLWTVQPRRWQALYNAIEPLRVMQKNQPIIFPEIVEN